MGVTPRAGMDVDVEEQRRSAMPCDEPRLLARLAKCRDLDVFARVDVSAGLHPDA